MFNNSNIIIQRYTLRSRKLKDTLRIAHLSDLHEKEFGEHNCGLFHSVAALQPHFIALTGDIVLRENQKKINKPYTVTLARELTRLAPLYFCLGNHERRHHEDVAYIFLENGAHIMDGNIHTQRVGKSTVNISGMADPSFGTDADQATGVMRECHGYNVFLSHRPEIFKQALGRNIDLLLCGHTHAGQIRLPGVGCLAVSGQGFLPKYVQGEFTERGTTMIISRGLGASGYPTIRVNNPPELVLIEAGPV